MKTLDLSEGRLSQSNIKSVNSKNLLNLNRGKDLQKVYGQKLEPENKYFRLYVVEKKNAENKAVIDFKSATMDEISAKSSRRKINNLSNKLF